MKKSRNSYVWIAVVMLCGAMVCVSGCNSAFRTYDGKAKSLEEVSVISIIQETCPITRIDGELVGLKYQAGNEYHLLPGIHVIQVVQQKEVFNDHLNIELVDLAYDFQAGHVYSIPKTSQPVDQEDLMNMEWTPYIADQGEVVAFAAQNPDYRKHSRAWKKLRKENGLTPSFFDRFKSKSTKIAKKQPVKNF